ncbi:TetR/AcrR family transcriptional regulator C-terminal domain-containing protein [Actinoplanes sp. NPDC051343]|uniref:TetR/AcrR family transcriptional regulator C-terminal domain-containing protein n=1 Tax=Actinoplanes sp. NPDC051343 TaxID=3363906 RepID=UPI0037A31618
MSTDEPARARGRRTRARILDQAAELFAGQDYAAVSVAEIARSAGAHPHQVTYYFGSKDALFVQAAFLLLLREARDLEPIGLRQRTPAAFREAVARTTLTLPALPVVVRAMSISRLRPELQKLAQHRLAILFRQAEHYLAGVLERHDWTLDRPIEVEVRTFWSAVLGARLISESGYGGHPSDIDVAGVLTVHSKAAA